jgi:hypothetical protein
MHTVHQAFFPDKHTELNAHEHKQRSEGQEHQVPFRGRNSTGHAGNVRMIENATTRLPIQAEPRKVVTAQKQGLKGTRTARRIAPADARGSQ